MNNEYSALYKKWTRFLKEKNMFIDYVTKKCFSYTTKYILDSIFYLKNGFRDDLSSINDTESFCFDVPWWAISLFLEFERTNKRFLRKKSSCRKKESYKGHNNEPWYVKNDKNYIRNKQRIYFK